MKYIFSLLILSTIIGACSTKTNETVTIEVQDSTSVKSIDNEWIVLFDGTSTDGWRGYNSEILPPGWVARDGVLTFDTEAKTEAEYTGGRDVIYGAEEFDNFELYLEWKVPPGGNSGVFYHLKEGYGGPPEVSPEYQLLDDLGWEEINNAKLEEWQKTAADYAMHSPDTTVKITKPAGEWNTSRIIFTPAKVEHWHNGQLVVSFVPWSDDWNERKDSGKWDNAPDYAKYKTGYIGLQDHDSPLEFRNIKIKKL